MIAKISCETAKYLMQAPTAFCKCSTDPLRCLQRVVKRRITPTVPHLHNTNIVRRRITDESDNTLNITDLMDNHVTCCRVQNGWPWGIIVNLSPPNNKNFTYHRDKSTYIFCSCKSSSKPSLTQGFLKTNKLPATSLPTNDINRFSVNNKIWSTKA